MVQVQQRGLIDYMLLRGKQSWGSAMLTALLPRGHGVCLRMFRSQWCPNTRMRCTMPATVLFRSQGSRAYEQEHRSRCKASIPEPKRNRVGDPEASIPRKSCPVVVPTAHRKTPRCCGSSESRLLLPPPCSSASRSSWMGVVLPPVTATTP